MNDNSDLAGVVLAGGESRRMGVDKNSLPFGMETMLGYISRQLGEICPMGVWVVAAAGRSPLDVGQQNVHLAYDRITGRGPIEGFVVALTAIPDGANVFVTSCDMPFVNGTLVNAMANRLAASHADAVVIDDGQQIHPLSGVYRTRIFSVAQSQIDQGRFSLLGMLDQLHVKAVDREFVMQFDPELRSLLNVNRPRDYETALQMLEEIQKGKIRSPKSKIRNKFELREE